MQTVSSKIIFPKIPSECHGKPWLYRSHTEPPSSLHCWLCESKSHSPSACPRKLASRNVCYHTPNSGEGTAQAPGLKIRIQRRRRSREKPEQLICGWRTQPGFQRLHCRHEGQSSRSAPTRGSSPAAAVRPELEVCSQRPELDLFPLLISALLTAKDRY